MLNFKLQLAFVAPIIAAVSGQSGSLGSGTPPPTPMPTVIVAVTEVTLTGLVGNVAEMSEQEISANSENCKQVVCNAATPPNCDDVMKVTLVQGATASNTFSAVVEYKPDTVLEAAGEAMELALDTTPPTVEITIAGTTSSQVVPDSVSGTNDVVIATPKAPACPAECILTHTGKHGSHSHLAKMKKKGKSHKGKHGAAWAPPDCSSCVEGVDYAVGHLPKAKKGTKTKGTKGKPAKGEAPGTKGPKGKGSKKHKKEHKPKAPEAPNGVASAKTKGRKTTSKKTSDPKSRAQFVAEHAAGVANSWFTAPVVLVVGLAFFITFRKSERDAYKNFSHTTTTHNAAFEGNEVVEEPMLTEDSPLIEDAEYYAVAGDRMVV